MDDIQKERIKSLRANGCGYAKIAQTMNISENTVKSFCRRNEISREPDGEYNKPDISDKLCRQCGAPLRNTPGRRQKLFCGAECRRIYWKENQNRINRRSAVKYICSVCGKSFFDYSKNKRKYCSRDCYTAGRHGGGGVIE